MGVLLWLGAHFDVPERGPCAMAQWHIGQSEPGTNTFTSGDSTDRKES